jgi:aldehyde dehydrogenase (NAD+)
MEHFRMFINGEFVDAVSGKTMECVDPGTGQPFATVPCGGTADADAAIKAARAAFDSGVWCKLTPEQRSEIIMDLADRIEADSTRLTMYESMDSGGVVTMAGGNIWSAAMTLRNLAWYASHKFLWREELPSSGSVFGNGRNIIVREPIGVCVGIVPWNLPFAEALWKIAHAISMGNTIVIKPASDTSVSALILGDIISQSRIPKGVINIVTGPGNELGEALCSHPDVDRTSFTGSTEVGRRIMQLGADTIKKVTLELGGKSANIVLEDADLDLAVDGSLFATFVHVGQVCVAGSRLLVAESIYRDFVNRLKERVSEITIGYQLMPDSQIGPVVNAKQLEKIETYVSIGKEEGANLICGGKRPEGDQFMAGYYHLPTIFADVNNSMQIAREEIFGPVLCVIPFKDEGEAIRIANDSTYGLAGGIWSRDTARAQKIAEQIRTGTMWINDYGVLGDFAPFGGYKQSGLGREFGYEGLAEYTETKRVYVSAEANRERPNFQVLFRYPHSATFSFHGPTKINAGPGSIASISKEITSLGCKRAVLITDKGLKDAGIVEIATRAMGDYCAGVFDGVEPDTGYDIIDRAVALCKEVKADCLVSLGGGSSIDTAKGASVTLANGGKAIDNISVFRLVGPQTPHIAIPTTHGTGSEVTSVAVILNKELKKKFFIVEQGIIPNAAILDATLTTRLPKGLSIGTGMDALTHAIEAVVSKTHNPIASAHGLQSIRLISDYLPRVAENGEDIEARQQMQVAAVLAGWAISAMNGMAHSIAHTVGSLCHIHHGTACGIALPHAMRFNRDFALNELVSVAQALGVEVAGMTPEAAADAAADAVAELLIRIGHPTRYSELGVTDEMFEQIIMGTMTDGANYGNPRPVSDPAAIGEFVKACF